MKSLLLGALVSAFSAVGVVGQVPGAGKQSPGVRPPRVIKTPAPVVRQPGSQAPGKQAPGKQQSGNRPVGAAPGTTGVADRIARRAQQMREQLRHGRPIKSHVRVQVRLKNGNRLRGVVKDGRLVERVTGLRFEDAHAADKGAGIRVWYSGGTRNYVFVPFSELKHYTVLQRLTHEQLAELETELQMKERERLARRQQRAGGTPGGVTGSAVPSQPAGESVPGQSPPLGRMPPPTAQGRTPVPGQLPGQLPTGYPTAAGGAGAGGSTVTSPLQQAGLGGQSGAGTVGSAGGTQSVGFGGRVQQRVGELTTTGGIGSNSGTGSGATTGTTTKTTAKSSTGGGDTGSSTTTSETETEEHRDWYQLLQSYPPTAGWNSDKRDEISRRFQVIGARPSEKEQAFVDRFAEWQKACKHFGVTAGKSGEGTGIGGKVGGKATGGKSKSGTGSKSESGEGSKSGSRRSTARDRREAKRKKRLERRDRRRSGGK